MSMDRSAFKISLDAQLDHQPTKAELINKDFLDAKEQLIKGSPLQKRAAFVRLMNHHIVRAARWLGTEVRNESLQQDLNKDIVKKENIPAPVRPSVSFMRTLGEIQASFTKDERSLKAEELLALSILYNTLEAGGKKWDAKESVRVAKLAAEQGLAVAQNALASYYNWGHGVKEDRKKTVELLTRAASQHHGNSQHDLGACHRDGLGVPANLQIAIEWFQKSADNLDAEGQFSLAMCYLNGSGVDRDPRRAIELLTLSAEQDYAVAQCALGIRYYQGTAEDGVKKNDRNAASWFSRAAGQYDNVALYNLAYCYANGEGVTQSSELAYACATLVKKESRHYDELTKLANDMMLKSMNDRSLMTIQFLKSVKPTLDKYVAHVQDTWKIDAENMQFVNKTFLRTLQTQSVADELFCKAAEAVGVVAERKDKKIESSNAAAQSLEEDLKKQDAVTNSATDLPDNIRINYNFFRSFIGEALEQMIDNDAAFFSQIEPIKCKKDDKDEKTIPAYVRSFSRQAILFLFKWIIQLQDRYPINLGDVPKLVVVFENFLAQNEYLNRSMSQSTALAPLPVRDALLYRAFDVPALIYAAFVTITHQNVPVAMIGIIINYLLPAELESDLRTGLVFTPQLLHALSNVSCDDKTARITFDAPIRQRDQLGLPARMLQTYRDTFFKLNQEHFTEVKSGAENKVTVDAKVGDPIRGYSVALFSTQPSREFEILKQKLSFAVEYTKKMKQPT
jgi:TPR repeat protein